ncbi:MAG: pyridoxal-dependent decarboxylase [Actinomycetota bacterium]|nr:pyridoxal-dependent decarboxylase [Actinomycetota bacterium]
MTSSGFRSDGASALEWVADYLEGLDQVAVSPSVAPGDIAARLPAHAPEEPEPFDTILADLDRIVVPGLTHWQAPGFFAYFPASSSPPSVLGELVSAGLAVNGMLWSTSPACTELEMVVLEWLVELLGLPDQFRFANGGGGVIEDSASSATLCALVAARERALRGATLDRLTLYGTSEAHSSLPKGAKIAGFAHDQLRRVPVLDDFSMDPSALSRMVADDRAAGFVPCFVLATSGTTSSMAFDPLEQVGAICREEGMWLHVDAAMAGSAAICPELRAVHQGVELADSYAFNPHKWLLTNFDCTCFYVRDRNALTDALSVTPEYLRNAATASGSVVDYRDWQVPLGRRFRALKLWFVLRTYGAEGLRRHLRHHLSLTEKLRERLEADGRFSFCAPPALDLLCFAHVTGNAATERLLRDVNDTRRVLLSHTVLAGRYTIRCAVGGAWTEERHVDELWELLDRLAPPAATAVAQVAPVG